MAPRKKKKPKDLDSLMTDDPFLEAGDPVDPTKDVTKEPVGAKVYVTLPRFSRKLRQMIKDQKEKGISDGQFLKLSSGLILEYNKTYLVELTPEIKKLLMDRVLMGGGRLH